MSTISDMVPPPVEVYFVGHCWGTCIQIITNISNCWQLSATVSFNYPIETIVVKYGGYLRLVGRNCFVISRLAVQFRPLAPYNIMGYELILIAHFYYVLVNVSSEILNICDLITNIDESCYFVSTERDGSYPCADSVVFWKA